MKHFILLFSFVCSILGSFSVFSQTGNQQEKREYSQHEYQQEKQQFSEAELAQMLAPIALYPDSLLTHILISSTYPIEIVEAHRWLKKNEKLNAEQIAKLVEHFEWDASVKALVPFESILSRLSDDLSWMQQLGDAFLQDETRVLAAIQALREQAKLAGNLDKMENTNVSYEENNIIIEPVKKEVVYVPYYDTRMVYGNWHWSSYPPVYWTPYSRVHVSHYSPFYWHSGIHISFNYFFSTFQWHKRHVVVVNPYKTLHYRSRRVIASGGYAKRWSHQPVHRRGVAYRTKHTSKKYYGNQAKFYKNKKSSHLAQRHFKQRLSSNNHFINKRKANKEPVRHNKNLLNVPKQHSAHVNYTKSIQGKGLSHKANAKKVTSKKNQKLTKNHYNSTKGKSIKHSTRKQHQYTASVKRHNTSRKKARN